MWPIFGASTEAAPSPEAHMKACLLSLFLTVPLAFGFATTTFAQSRSSDSRSSYSRDDDFDDYYHRSSPQGKEEGESLTFLWILIALGVLGGGGWYAWDYYSTGDLFD